MTEPTGQGAETIRVVDYDPAWAQLYERERELVLAAAAPHLLALEHVGSTAVPGLAAKPIVDMMAAVASLADGRAARAPLEPLGYRLVETGMPGRLLLRRRDAQGGCGFHLHIVEQSSWAERNERLLRDHLLAHPDDARAYGALKRRLAAELPRDGAAYTRAKTALIQQLVDRARDERGLARVDVWEE